MADHPAAAMPKNKPQSSAKSSQIRKSVAPPAAIRRSATAAGTRKPAPAPTPKTVAPPARKSVAPASRKPTAQAEPAEPRKFGLRGAAPWALRHAERQAAEAARRNREPPKPGSARATLRTPEAADHIKASIGELHGLLQKLRTLQKNLGDNYFELAEILAGIAANKLHEAKGYSSIEVFAERELAIGKGLALKLVRIPSLFQRGAARALGLEALSRAIDAIDQAPQTSAASRAAKLPLKPPKMKPG